MIKLSETSEAQKWNAMMDALEANWLVKMADTRDEYRRDGLPSLENMLEPLDAESSST